jgi:hypothetical protein
VSQLDFVQRIDLPIEAIPLQERPSLNIPTTKEVPTFDSKIIPLIQNWQFSTDKEEFAEKNNMSYQDDELLVYIYMDSQDSLSKLPQGIEVTSSADNIVVAYLDSRQITEVSQLDFVQRIDLPIEAVTPPPSPPEPFPLQPEEFNDVEETVSVNYEYLIIIAIAIIIAALIISTKRKRSQQSLNLQK